MPRRFEEKVIAEENMTCSFLEYTTLHLHIHKAGGKEVLWSLWLYGNKNKEKNEKNENIVM